MLPELKKFVVFLCITILIASIKIYSQQCGQLNVTLNADGTFESLIGVASNNNLNKDVTGGGWTNGSMVHAMHQLHLTPM